jgi:hypothetical protein
MAGENIGETIIEGPAEIEIRATDSATGQAASAHDHFVTAIR